MPWTMAAFTLAALSMVGLPPLAGFFSKWYLVLGGVDGGQWIFVAVILFSSLLNAVYFFRVLERTYLEQRDEPGDPEPGPRAVYEGGGVDTPSRSRKRFEPPLSMLVPTLILAVAILIAGLANGIIVDGVLRRALPPGMVP